MSADQLIFQKRKLDFLITKPCRYDMNRVVIILYLVPLPPYVRLCSFESIFQTLGVTYTILKIWPISGVCYFKGPYMLKKHWQYDVLIWIGSTYFQKIWETRNSPWDILLYEKCIKFFESSNNFDSSTYLFCIGLCTITTFATWKFRFTPIIFHFKFGLLI